MHDINFAVGDRVKVMSKILKTDLHKPGNVWSTELTGLVINIDATIETKPDFKTTGHIVSIYVDGGLGLWEFGTNYWKIRKIKA